MADNAADNDGNNYRRNSHDSGLEDESSDSSTYSLTSSIMNYTYENGRRYHAYREGQYFMPNDDQEQEGMDLMHHISLMILGGNLYRAPVKEPMDILEIGTGTGIWAVDVADEFPAARVIGIDLSPIQPLWRPSNLEFQISDCESEWTFDHKFDFIHMRNMSGSIADWPQLLQRCYENLKPGGWIECSNMEATGRSANNNLPAECATLKWQSDLKAAAAHTGREMNVGPRLKQLIQDVGFDNVKEEQHQVPVSPWMRGKEKKRLALFFQYLASKELEAVSLRLYTQVLGWKVEELQVLLMEVRKEIFDPANQMFSMMYYVTGQKAATEGET